MFLTLENPSPKSASKISVVTRCVAKGIDMCVIFALSFILPYPLGVLLGFIYTLVHDGISGGQSLGKRVCQLRVVRTKDDKPCTLRESVIRNAPLGVATFFGIIPFWGWILLVLLGIPLVALEVYLMLTLENGGRLGDVMADTRVIEAPKNRNHSK